MGARPRVVIARRLPAAGLELLERKFELDAGTASGERAALLKRAAGASALIADPTVAVDAQLLDAAGPQLRVVANFAVGYDNIDLDACRSRGVTVTNTPDVLTNATAELTMALMLSAARRLGLGERLLRSGAWSGWEPEQLLGRELAESTIGIVGLGRIGSRVAELLSGFGSRLLYASRTARPELEQRLGISPRQLDELVAEADVVTLHVALDPSTRHLIDADRLRRFKPGSLLVNTARGGLVDTPALIEALQFGPLWGAALDVYENEPHVDPGLLELDNVVLAPHLGSATRTARDGMATLAARNVIEVLEGRDPLTPVTGEARPASGRP
jgi:glyoxylate reductase